MTTKVNSSENKQIKSKKRVAEHGEVFTAEREVKAMCDLVKDETERLDSRFLELACGDGNFLVEILSRKLAVYMVLNFCKIMQNGAGKDCLKSGTKNTQQFVKKNAVMNSVK